MGGIEGFFWGVAGGFLGELLTWHKMRQAEDYPLWATTKIYWIITALMILAGGVLVVAYLRSDFKLNAIIAINLGASAPFILGSAASHIPAISPERTN